MEIVPLSLIAADGKRQASARSEVLPTENDASAGNRPRLVDILRSHGMVAEDALADAQSVSATHNLRLGQTLCANGSLRPEHLVKALERQWGLRRIDLAAAPADARLVSRIGPLTCLHHQAMPWRRIGAATVVITEDPEKFETHRALYEDRLGPVMVALAGPQEVGKAIARTYTKALVSRAEARVPPHLSSRRWRTEPFRICAAALALSTLVLAIASLPLLLTGLLILAVVSLALISALKIAAIIAQARPEPETATIHALNTSQHKDRLPVFSILVPLFREEHIAGHLVRRLERLDYPRALLDVCLIVEAKDKVTHATLSRTDLPSWMRVITVPAGAIQTKPRAMNYALDFCRGSLIGIYDAEDAPDPQQLRKVAARFAVAGPRVACLQGALDFYNTGHNWLSRCFTLEYAAWFRILLPGIARLGLAVPLGGTTLFFRRDVLESLGAWDAHNVTEDADLGLRLTRAGFRTEIIDTVTEEEACAHSRSWVKQRSRWLKGFAMTWAVHMRRPRLLWHDLGARGFIGFQIMFICTLMQFALAPILWSMWAIPLGLPHPVAQIVPDGWLWCMGGVYGLSKLANLAMTFRAMQVTDRLRLMPMVLLQPIYFAHASLAMYKALTELFNRPFYWDKTQHGAFGGSRVIAAQIGPRSVHSPS